MFYNQLTNKDMKNLRDLLEQEILSDAKNGDTTVLAAILESLTDEYVYASLSDEGQESLNWYELKEGDKIICLKNTFGLSNSYNTPEKIDIFKGTMLVVTESSSHGHCFTKFIHGNAVKYLRGRGYEGQTSEQGLGDKIILNGGHKSRSPYDLGLINLRIWKLVKDEK